MNRIFSFRIKIVSGFKGHFWVVTVAASAGLFLKFLEGDGEGLWAIKQSSKNLVFVKIRPKKSQTRCLIVQQRNIQSIGTKKWVLSVFHKC